jgi:hypothetical protein
MTNIVTLGKSSTNDFLTDRDHYYFQLRRQALNELIEENRRGWVDSVIRRFVTKNVTSNNKLGVRNNGQT